MIERTFYRNSIGFTSVCDTAVSCPPYNIASIALRRVVPEASIELPEGYSAEELENITWLTGYYDQSVQVSGRQARELRQIGEQLLSLDYEHKIQPPLTITERLSIEHLVKIVPVSTD